MSIHFATVGTAVLIHIFSLKFPFAFCFGQGGVFCYGPCYDTSCMIVPGSQYAFVCSILATIKACLQYCLNCIILVHLIGAM